MARFEIQDDGNYVQIEFDHIPSLAFCAVCLMPNRIRPDDLAPDSSDRSIRCPVHYREDLMRRKHWYAKHIAAHRTLGTTCTFQDFRLFYGSEECKEETEFLQRYSPKR